MTPLLQPPRRWLLLTRVGLVLLVTRLQMSLFGFDRMHRNLKSLAATPRAIGSPRYGRELCWALAALKRHLPLTQSCLLRAVTGARVLARNELRFELYIATGKRDGHFGAHAWLESDGQPITADNGHQMEEALTEYRNHDHGDNMLTP